MKNKEEKLSEKLKETDLFYYRAYETIEKYKRRSGVAYHYISAQIAFWSTKRIFASYPCEHFPRIERNKLKIAFRLCGGLGDYLIGLNYIACFEAMLKKEGVSYSIDTYINPKKVKMLQTFYSGYVGDETLLLQRDGYDLVVSLLRVPQADRYKTKRVKKISPALWNWILKHVRYEQYYPIIFRHPGLGGIVSIHQAIAAGRKRIQEPDVFGLLGVGIDFAYEIPNVPDKDAIQKRFGLPDRFITLNRGVDEFNLKATSCKMWPLEYYNRLIPLLKAAYPDYAIVQLGVSEERSPLMTGVDFNLVGKTTLDDLKGILKASSLHIDGEGGMIHLRHALRGGPSVVFFGPTPKELYGYPENLNLSSSVCRWCEWQHEEWSSRCMKTGGEAECMAALTPENVLKGIQSGWNPRV